MTVGSGPVVGRERELAAVEAFAAGEPYAGEALLLAGEAGIGKTTIWRHGVEAAAEAGRRALTARPAGAEADFSFAALGDLVGAVREDLLPGLSAPQRRALDVALLLEEAGGRGADRRAVSLAILNGFRTLAADAPVLVAVDDVQWLDPPSASVLAFAARRLQGQPVAFLLARREDESGPTPLEHALGTELARIDVGPLGLEALHEVLHARLGTALPRPVLRRIHELAAGNPFYALELARAVERDAVALAPDRALPVTLELLVRDRLGTLPPKAQRALALAGALAQPTVAVVAAAADEDVHAALDPAVGAHVVTLHGERIEFAHPLLASGAYLSVEPAERRAIHRRLAAAVPEPEERARHLALAADGPDADVAAALDEAAAGARARGAPDAAALLTERALLLTPEADVAAAARRLRDAGMLHFESGDAPRARALLEDAVARAAPGRERARALVRLARVRSYGDDLREAAVLFRTALAESEGDAALEASAHEGLSACAMRLREGIGDGISHAQAAVLLAQESGDDALAAEALGSQLVLEALSGREVAPRTLKTALAAGAERARERVLAHPHFIAAVVWLWWDELERARAALEDLLLHARELGDESSLPYVLVILAQTECRLGDLHRAAGLAEEALELSVQAGQEWLQAYAHALSGLASAYLGRDEACRVAVERALSLAERTSSAPAELFARTALGHLELSRGDAAAALQQLEPLAARAQREGMEEPGATPFLPDAVEALIAAGRDADAGRLLDWYEGNATRLGRVSGLAAAARLRGLLAAARGDAEGAVAQLERAEALHKDVPMPLERGRTLLALGAAHRRAKSKRSAREALERACRLFEETEAAVWAASANAELGRIGGRAPSGGELTPSERRVAALVAEGRTNRETAAALFVSERTVEGHLSRVYAKLGVRSRAELARRFQDPDATAS